MGREVEAVKKLVVRGRQPRDIKGLGTLESGVLAMSVIAFSSIPFTPVPCFAASRSAAAWDQWYTYKGELG